METTTNSQWRLPVLSDEQKDRLVDAWACGVSFAVFPDYVPNIPEDVLS